LALASTDGHAGAVPHVSHRAQIVAPPTGLLEPYQTELSDEAREFDRLLRGPCLIRVGREDEILSPHAPRDPYTLRVCSRVEPADLEFETCESKVEERTDLVLDVRLLSVITADRDHGDARAIAAPEPPERLRERLAHRIPNCRI